MLDELSRHDGVAFAAGALYSPATVGTRYLDYMGLRRPITTFTDLDGWELGWTGR
jgi:hypothetical protein